jgi:hypothetical protein
MGVSFRHCSYVCILFHCLIATLGTEVPLVEDVSLSMPKIRGVGSRWMDLFPQSPADKEQKNHFLHSVLSKRDFGKTPLKSQVAVSSTSPLFYSGTEEKFLWCFLLREDSNAGLVTQMRHMVDCHMLAKKLKRTMISPPLLASGMDPLVWPRFWDELVDLSKIEPNSNSSNSWHPGSNTIAADVSANIDVFAPAGVANSRPPKWIREFMSKFLGFKQVSLRRHGVSDLASFGKKQRNQHTLFVAFDSEARRKTEQIVASLQPGNNKNK